MALNRGENENIAMALYRGENENIAKFLHGVHCGSQI
jgi:hypothetical protein